MLPLHHPPAAAVIDILPTTPEEELPAANMPGIEATNETEPAANTTAAPAPAKSSAAGASYNLAFTVAAVVLGAVMAL